jgi:integrase/recombinase XerD
MCAARGWTMSCTPPRWAITSLARSYSPPARAARRARPDLAAGLNGLRVSEATGADTEQLGLERGHRTLAITRTGGTVVTIPLAPRTGRRSTWPSMSAPKGALPQRRRAAAGPARRRRIVRRVTRRAGISKHVSPHTLRHAFITAARDAGVPLRDVQEGASHADPRTTMRYERARTSLDRHATYIVAAFIAGAAR